jgi:LPXTG-site transpeptidase (sortase) family protein
MRLIQDITKPDSVTDKIVSPRTVLQTVAVSYNKKDNKLFSRGQRNAVFGLVLLFIVFSVFFSSKAQLGEPGSSAAASGFEFAPESSTLQPDYSPWVLSIPSLSLNAAVQNVGTNPDGYMSTPTKPEDVGWFETGVKPGSVGNAVIAGHLNSGRNKPAVFQNLHKLKPGDSVYIIENNKKLSFKVTDVQTYHKDDAPLDKIFGKTTESHLNLITCDGSWDKAQKDYDKRLVVYTELIR